MKLLDYFVRLLEGYIIIAVRFGSLNEPVQRRLIIEDLVLLLLHALLRVIQQEEMIDYFQNRIDKEVEHDVELDPLHVDFFQQTVGSIERFGACETTYFVDQ